MTNNINNNSELVYILRVFVGGGLQRTKQLEGLLSIIDRQVE
jgi:hypothetical protein